MRTFMIAALVAAVFAQDTLSACAAAREAALAKADPTLYVPVCQADGSFAPQQCNDNIEDGECWCVDDAGQKLDVDVSECEMCSLMTRAMVAQEMDDMYLPDCDEDGTFAPIQCFGDDCYCCDAWTGQLDADLTFCQESEDNEEEEDVQTTDGTEEDTTATDNEEVAEDTDATVEATENNEEATEDNEEATEDNEEATEDNEEATEAAEQEENAQGSDASEQTNEQGSESAQAEEPLCSRMLKQLVAQEVDDALLPDCNDDGTFVARQCFGEDCFCVDPLTGEPSTDLTACPVEETTEDNEEATEDAEQVIGDDIATDDEDDEDEDEDEGFSMGPSAAGAAILGVAMVGIASFVVVKRRSQEPEAFAIEDETPLCEVTTAEAAVTVAE